MRLALFPFCIGPVESGPITKEPLSVQILNTCLSSIEKTLDINSISANILTEFNITLSVPAATLIPASSISAIGAIPAPVIKLDLGQTTTGIFASATCSRSLFVAFVK